VDDVRLELQRRIEALERKNKLLDEGLRQAERQRQMFERTAQELQAAKSLLIRQGEALKEDIAERSRVEAALGESHQQMYSLLNSMAEGAYGVDTEGRCRFVNRSFLRILGYDSADGIIGQPIHPLIHRSRPDGSVYPAGECRMCAAYRRGEEVHVVDEMFWRKDGAAVPVEYWAQPLITDGVLTGAIATFVDITERKRIEARLADSESRLRTIVESEPECIKLIDAEGRLLQINPTGLKMIEAERLEQAVGRNVAELIAPEYREAYLDLHRRVLAGETVQMEYELEGLKGGRRWVETHAVPMAEADGNIVHLSVTRDITERKHSERQLRIAATVFESQEGIVVTDADKRILRVNKAFSDITGYSADEVIGENPRLLRSGRHDRDFYTVMWKTIAATGAWEGEIWNRRKNGEIYPDHLAITAVKDRNGNVTHYVGTHMDITLKKASAEEIERLAFYDPLTKLPNRRLLQDRLKAALAACCRSGHKGALLFIDLDNFKTLNDTLGHDMGDLLLQLVAGRLNACVRACDTVARLGGDEFVVMLQDLSGQSFEATRQAEKVGNKLLMALNEPYKLAARDYVSTPSIGAALFHGHEPNPEELLKQADIAMYQAKTSGRNTLRFFDPQMQSVISARFSLEDELRKALDYRQFQLYYQLQVDGMHRPVGAEALIRWLHPERGLVFPDAFIPLAEDTGLIFPIGRWALETACAQLRAWRRMPAARNFSLSVNVSAKQFFHADFTPQVLAAIRDNSINPGSLKLELTESILIKNIEEAIAIMNALGEIGVQFSLDDFGTGYSSLQYIKRLPLNQLKIDRSFIRDIADDNNDQAIVRTIIAMAKSLGLNVIAEGVESEAQRQFLLDNGCASFQGYLFGKPAPIAQFEALLKQRLSAPESEASSPAGD
jgi:diguanylate cyclase (GGDEF)-like protein/PAS domain S-box-containing protein